MRDLTEKQYRDALARHGFSITGIGSRWVKHPDFPNTMYGCIWNLGTGKVARRATVAKVIKDLDQDRQKARAAKAKKERDQ